MDIPEHPNVTNNFTGDVELERIPQWCFISAVGVLACIFVPGFFGNLLTVKILVLEKQRSSTDWYLMFLAICKFTTIIVNLPTEIYLSLQMENTHSSTCLCKFNRFFFSLTYGCSSWLIFIIATDRFLKICYMHSKNVLQRKPIVIMSVIFGAILVASVFIYFNAGETTYGICVFNLERHRVFSYFFLMMASIWVVLALVVCIIYMYIGLLMRHTAQVAPTSLSQDRTRLAERRRNLIVSSKVLIAGAMSFLLLTTIPTFTVNFMNFTGYKERKPGIILKFLFTKVYYIDVCINPFLYLGMNLQFRARLKSIFQFKLAVQPEGL